MNSKPEWVSELTYNRRSGILRRNGARIGRIGSSGYLIYVVDNTEHKVHRLIFLVVTGEWPEHMVDHINGVRTDNRWVNLRDVPMLYNAQNLRRLQVDNTSGFMGVSWYKRKHKWLAQIRVNRVKKTLGYYDTPDQAHASYLAARRELHVGNTL